MHFTIPDTLRAQEYVNPFQANIKSCPIVTKLEIMYKGVPFRIVNAYFQSVGRGGGPRPAERAQWDFLLEESSEIPCIVGGDFNAHSPVWNKRCLVRRNATFLEDLIRRFNLSILNDQSQTRFGGEGHSIIDLTLATPSAAVYCRDWTTLELDEGTGSDHTVIEWKWQDEAARSDGGWKFRGWALKKKLDEEKEAQKRGESVNRGVMSNRCKATTNNRTV